MEFEWDQGKNIQNILKHGISFYEAQNAFFDKKRVVALDTKHSTAHEKRYFCFGYVNDRIITVRFTFRKNKIRIIGAGCWREGRTKYEEKNNI
jgi:uncharacterized DUF497 family protein